MSLPEKLEKVLQDACRGKLPEGEILTFDHIIEVAEEMVKVKGYVDYSDYDAELLAEVLNGYCRPSKLGFRQYPIRYALTQRGWQETKGKPKQFSQPSK